MRSLYKNAELTIFASFCGPTNIPPLEALAWITINMLKSY